MKRYAQATGGCMDESENGEWVQIEDVHQRVAELESERFGFLSDQSLRALFSEVPSCQIVEGGVLVLWRTLALRLQELRNAQIESADACLEQIRADSKAEALNDLAKELEVKKTTFVHEHFIYDPTTGAYEGSVHQEDWVAGQEELIEEMHDRANAFTKKAL